MERFINKYYFPVTKAPIELIQMIMNTPANIQHSGNSRLYDPPDPKYFDYENRYRFQRATPVYDVNTPATPIHPSTGIEGFLQQKNGVVTYKIQMLYSEMGQRSYINGQILYRINYDQCTCKNLIFQRGTEFLDRQRMELEQKILDLEQEKRREETAFFRDLSFLNKELRFARIEALEEKQKQALCLNMEVPI
jgi:hypothetical protein